MLRQFEIARLVASVPTTPWHFPPQSPCLSVLNVPAGTIFLVLRPHSGSGNLPIPAVLQGFHNWTLNLPYDGVAGVGGAVV